MSIFWIVAIIYIVLCALFVLGLSRCAARGDQMMEDMYRQAMAESRDTKAAE